jgi:hypothetical protein
MYILNVHTNKLLQTETDKWQAWPLVREGAPQRQDSNYQTATLGEEVIFGHKSKSGLDTMTYWLTDWLTVSRNVTLTLTFD